MRFHKTKINNQKGSAAVMVMSVIMILTMLGLVALMGSVSGIKMSSRYKNWSSDFYKLDKIAEEYVKDVDGILGSAESMAKVYMESAAYTDAGYTDASIDAATQGVINTNAWMNQVGNTYEEYVANNPLLTGAQVLNLYKNDLDIGYKATFNRVYYLYMTKALQPYLLTSTEVIADASTPLSGYLTLTDWNTYTPSDILLNIKSPDAADPTKKVEVKLKIFPPQYQTVVQTINKPIKGNPLWGYAVVASSGAGVASGNTVNIYGDIMAANGNIAVGANSTLNTHGNVYTSGNVSLANNSTFHAFDHTTVDILNPSYVKRSTIYKNASVGVNTGDSSIYSSAFNAYIEGDPSLGAGEVPFFYNDLTATGWGNIYCSNLLISDGVVSANAIIEGNLITKDDIELNGATGNRITINGNYVGISSEGAPETASGAIDPNASSTIINNAVIDPATDDYYTLANTNEITLNGGIIVPGTAFRTFDGPTYYQTVESVTGRDRPLFEVYLESTTSGAVEVMYLTKDAGLPTESLGVYPMKASTDIATRRTDFIDFLTGINIKTFVNGSSNINGYALGAVVIHQDGAVNATKRLQGAGATPIDSLAVNASNWQSVKAGKLKEFFEAKTKFYGFNGVTMADLVNESSANSTKMGKAGMIYLSGDQSYDPSGKSGIIYCDGNLTLIGSGQFDGVIIATKNITIDGDLILRYDEQEVIRVITDQNGQSVRDFFNKPVGLMDYAYYLDYDASGGTKTVLKRYNIMSWREVHKP